MEKRYFWIKVQADFFDSDEMDWIHEQPNGAEYIYIYQRLCLLAINNGGVIERRIGPKVMPYSMEKLADVVKSTSEHVKAAITLFRDIGLIENTENGAFALTRLSEMVGTGNETSAAKRMRRHRNAKRTDEVEDEGEDVTPPVTLPVTPVTETVTPSVTLPVTLPVTPEYRDKSLEIRDREREEEKDGGESSKGKAKKKTFSPDALIDALPYGEELKDAIRDWADMRSRMKNPFTERAFQLCMKELQDFGGGSEAKMVAIVNQTILNGWKGFFQLKSYTPPAASSPDRREQVAQAAKKGWD